MGNEHNEVTVKKYYPAWHQAHERLNKRYLMLVLSDKRKTLQGRENNIEPVSSLDFLMDIHDLSAFLDIQHGAEARRVPMIITDLTD